MAEVFAFLQSNGQTIIMALLATVGGFASLASLTPNKTDDRIIQMILDVINFLGGNFGKAKNN